MGKALPRRELTGCIRRCKKVDMSIYRRVMALSHLAIGFRRGDVAGRWRADVWNIFASGSGRGGFGYGGRCEGGYCTISI